MKILVVGSGGREHALAWRLKQCPGVKHVYSAPGNPGMAAIGQCLPAASVDDWTRAAAEMNVDFVVVGPEAPLVSGLVDRLRSEGIPAVGPAAEAAQLEGSKSFSKSVMTRAGVPTARHRTVTDLASADAALDEFGYPVVLKADGLAAGKGVVVAPDGAEARRALPALLEGGRLVVEEFLAGEEVSYIVLTDGDRFLPMQPTQDHKAIFDGDKGPNTGGMGAYRDHRILSAEQHRTIQGSIVRPVLAQMCEQGKPFTGFLYAGLMMTADGPKVLEFNARLGDPETQPLLISLRSDLAAVLHAAALGNIEGLPPLEWNEGASVCVVLAAHGYPGDVRTGDTIHGIEQAEASGAVVFQAGTRRNPSGLETAGGRVLGVTAEGENLRSAIDRAYAAADRIQFEGRQMRHDIGAKGLARW
jgi:phosphoribosylamine--glycine ligase